MQTPEQIIKNLTSFVEKWKGKYGEMPQDNPPIGGETKGYTTKDGQTLNIDKYEVGGMVTLSDGTPCPMGEVYLADGSTLYVDEAGMITKIEPVAVETAESVSEDMGKKLAEMKAKMEEMLAQFNEALSPIKETFSNQENEIKTLNEKLEKQESIISEMFGVLSSFSVQKPIEQPKQNFKTEKEDKIQKLIQSQLKK